MDNLMAHIEGINDERDLVPILLAVGERWRPSTGFDAN
jgi:hypothetical protein